jgi:hypothetical protein
VTGEKQRSSVLLEDPSELAVSLSNIASVLAEALDEPQADATQRVRYSAGILVRDVPGVIATRIQRGLADLGLSAFLVPQGELEAPPRALRLGRLEVAPSGLGVVGFMKAGDPEQIPWADVLSIDAWALAQQNPSDDLRDALPRRGGTLAKLSPDTRKLLDELRVYEERERLVVQLGLDLLLAGPRLYRVRCEDPGIYASLELDRGEEEAIEVDFADLAGFVLDNPDGPDWSGFAGSYVEWEGIVSAVDDEDGGVVTIRPRRDAPQGVRLTLRDPADVRVRDVAPGVTVAYRGRLDDCLREEGLFTVGDGQFRLSTHSVGNYLALVRKLVRLADGNSHVAKGTLRFAQRGDFTDILLTKREEQDATHTWTMQALSQGVLDGDTAEEVDDDELTDSDVALVVGDETGAFDDVDDLDDDDLEDDVDDLDDDDLEDDVDDLDDADLEDDVDDLDHDGDPALDLDDVDVPDEDDAPLRRAPRPLSTRIGALTDLGELDVELNSAMEHIAGKSTRLSLKHIQDMIASAESLESLQESLVESLEDELGEMDDELKEAMSFFEVAKSGKWKLADILGADAEVEDEAEPES